MKLRKWLLRISKITAWFIFSLILFLILVILIIRIPAVQTRLVHRAVRFVEDKIGTPVALESIELSFPKKVVLRNLYIQDKARDTLLNAGEIVIDTDLWALLQHTIQLNDVELSNITAHVYRLDRDSAFNFTYILNAFADSRKNTTDTVPSKPWTFLLHNIDVESLRFHFTDGLAGDKATLNLGKLSVGMDKFDLANSIFHANNVSMENMTSRIVQSKMPEASSDTLSEPLPDLSIHKIDLRNVNVRYEQRATRQVVYVALGNCTVRSKSINLKEHNMALGEVSLDHTFASYQQMQSNKEKPFPKNETSMADSTSIQPPLIPWNITVEKIAFTNCSLQYDDFNRPLTKEGLDNAHLWISNFNTEMENLALNNKKIGANIRNLSLREKNGFTVKSLAVDFMLTDHTIDVGNFIFDSGRSRIKLEGNAVFGSLAKVIKTDDEAKVSVSINKSHIHIADVLYFKPDLLDSLPVRSLKNVVIDLDLSAAGTVNNLMVHHLGIGTLTKTSLRAHGTIQGLPDLHHATLKVDVDRFYTTSSDAGMVLDSLSFKSFALPEWVNLEGKFHGAIRRPSIHALITSNIGNVDADIDMALDTTAHQQYKGSFAVKDFDLGKFLRQEQTIGKVNMNASIDGAGLTMQELDANVDLEVASFWFHNYNYTDFKLSGTQKQYFFSGKAFLHDKNIDFDIAADINYNDRVPAYKLTCDLKNADLKALHISERPLRTRGTLDVDLATADLKVINGSIALHHVAIFNGQALYKVDSLLFASIDQNGQTDIKITSDIVNGNFTGTLNLSGLPGALERYFNSYLALKNNTATQATKPENFKFNLLLKKTELLTDIIFPKLRSFEPGPITGEFNNLEHKLDLHIALGKIHYGDYALDSFLLNVNSTRRAITCVSLAKNFVYDSIRIYTMRLDGKVSDDSLRTSFIILDSLNKEKYKLGGLFRSLENVFQFHFLQDEVILNYEAWNTSSDNYLRFGPGGITTHNMFISNEEERILVERKTDSTATLLIGFRTLELGTLSGIISKKKSIVKGKINGELNIPMTPKSVFHAALKIDDLVILKQSWGAVDFSVHNITADKLKLSLSIEGENTNIKAEGTYSSVSSDISTTVSKINLKIIEPIIAKNIRDMSGIVSGSMTIKGDPKKPVVQGEITFKDAHFFSIYVNSAFRLENETFEFNERDILFKNFQVQDDNHNVASLQGSVRMLSFTDMELDLTLRAKNFQVLNTTAKNNKLYYGKVKVNSKATIKGTFDLPVVEMNVGFSDDTEFTYIIPQSEKGLLEQKGIVVFVDKDAKNDPFITSLHLADTVKSAVKGFSLTANIELSNKAIFNIIIDPITGDKLSVQGTSSLTLEMNPNGHMNLSGRYEISKGSYSLSFYKLVKRTFSIEKGGTITWYGDPLNAMLDIRAIYMVETSPMELLVTQVQGAAPEQYKQRIPFYVYLNIKGELLTPNISFLLDMPQDKKNIFSGSVYAKIQDINTRDSDLNKQVFALLVLQRFMADNPFENQASGDLATSARTSVSRILSDQLNRLSQNVKGVQLSFDVKSYEDYTSGQAAGQTQLRLGVSKNLLNDRLVVKLSGNVDVEGENNTQSSFTDYIGDLALEYKLTADGRLRVTGFRNSDYDMIDGELTKTGAGLIFIKDYDAFKELFKANEEQK